MEFINKPITEKEMNYFSLCDGHPCAGHDHNDDCGGCVNDSCPGGHPPGRNDDNDWWPWHCAQVSDNR